MCGASTAAAEARGGTHAVEKRLGLGSPALSEVVRTIHPWQHLYEH